MKLLNSIVPAFFKFRLYKIYEWIHHPVKKQLEIFTRLIQSAGDTEWGKTHDYVHIKSITDFKKQVPVQDYDSLKPFIEEILKGRQNILWHSDIHWFSKSSGTTSDKSKFIPMSEECMQENHFKGGKDIMTLYCSHYSETTIYEGKCLVMGGSHQISQLNEQAKYGDLSAVLLQNMPFIGRLFRAPDLEVALMDNWEQKIERMAAESIPQNITHLAGVPTWTLVLIKYILEKTGKSHIKEVWPNLELYLHGGVSFTPYREQFRTLIPSENMHYWQTYNASEGFFGIQDAPERDDMLLLTDHGIFYEFMPMSELGKEQPLTLQLEEVETNTNYAIIISTNGGLWRYLIGDTIQFTTLHPFRIKVTGRTKHFINAFGEEVIVDNADHAIAAACKQTGLKVLEYSAAPIYFSDSGNGGHEWLIEFEHPPENVDEFANILDLELQQLNSDYEAKRTKSIAMRMPVVHAVAPGTFHHWLKSKGKLGGQHKVPRLANHRKYVEEIKEFAAV